MDKHDPVLDEARSLVSQELAHISTHTNFESRKGDLQSRVFFGQKVIYFIDAPTSRSKILLESIKMVKSAMQGGGNHDKKWSLCIPCGHRIDLAGLLMQDVMNNFPKQPCFLVQCSIAQIQSKRCLPGLHCLFAWDWL